MRSAPGATRRHQGALPRRALPPAPAPTPARDRPGPPGSGMCPKSVGGLEGVTVPRGAWLCPLRVRAAFSACACAELNGRNLFQINSYNFGVRVRVRVRGWECHPACAWAVSLLVGCATQRVRALWPSSVCGIVVISPARTRAVPPACACPWAAGCSPHVFVGSVTCVCSCAGCVPCLCV